MTKKTNPEERLIVALDVSNYADGKHLVKRLAPLGVGFKIGLELIHAPGGAGENLAKLIHGLGGWVFWDCKLYDIPATMANAAQNIGMLAVSYFNVHASAGHDGILAVSQKKVGSRLLAVTVLTSFDEETCQQIYRAAPSEKVLEFARMAKKAGADGLVCSPREIALIRADPDLCDLELITPGIRPVWAAKNDQKRVMTPAEAILAGATAIVVGRPITKPDDGDIVGAAQRIIDEIADPAGTLVKQALARADAVITGDHFVYKAGNHGEVYINKDVVLCDPADADLIGKLMAQRCASLHPDCVIGPAYGAIALASWTAHHLSRELGAQVPSYHTVKKIVDGKEVQEIRPSYAERMRGKQVLIVEDIINTGASVNEVAELVKGAGAEVVGIIGICNRGDTDLPALYRVKMTQYAREDCPFCKEERPINTRLGKGKQFLADQATNTH